jgi:hypothetical protein
MAKEVPECLPNDNAVLRLTPKASSVAEIVVQNVSYYREYTFEINQSGMWDRQGIYEFVMADQRTFQGLL